MDTSALAKRMKKYEAVPKNTLMRRTPVIIRVDGRAFHTFTKGFQKPFDDVLMRVMQDTMKYLCENIQGCVFGYTQSDEITLILIDYKKLNSEAWFDYEVQKMCSIVASMATMAFNRFFMYEYEEFNRWIYEGSPTDEDKRLNDVYYNAMCKGAMFDARAFNLPKEEVTNNIYWRQLDASRNSIQMVGQANFSHRELLNKTCDQIQDMLMTQRGINWNDMATSYKRGSCCVRNRRFISTSVDGTETCEIRNPKEPETAWIIDNDIPIFKGKGIRGIMQCDVCGGSGKIDMPVVNKESNMKKAIIFDYCFEAPDELVDFCKNIGYSNPDFANDFDLMFDQRVVKFCEKRVEPLWSERVYKGKESYAFRCGFAGAGYIREIDTSKVWNLRHNNVDAPIINYVEVNTNKYGYLSVL